MFIIAAADTVMNRPSADLMAEAYPDVELRDGVGEFGTLLSIEKARRRARLRARVLLARRDHFLTPSSAASTSLSRSTSPRMPAAASLKRKASASFTIAYASVAGSTGGS